MRDGAQPPLPHRLSGFPAVVGRPPPSLPAPAPPLPRPRHLRARAGARRPPPPGGCAAAPAPPWGRRGCGEGLPGAGAARSAGASALPRRWHLPPAAALDPCPPPRSQPRCRRRVPGQTPRREGGREPGGGAKPALRPGCLGDGGGWGRPGGARPSKPPEARGTFRFPYTECKRDSPLHDTGCNRDFTAHNPPEAMG